MKSYLNIITLIKYKSKTDEKDKSLLKKLKELE